MVLLAVVLATAACRVDREHLLAPPVADEPASQPVPQTSVPASPPAAAPSLPALGCPGPVTPAPADLDQRVAAVEAETGTRVSLSLVDPARGLVSAGTLEPVAAWSTIKVPIALAVVQDQGPQAHPEAVRAALRESDNEAADQLWRSLGPPPQAAARVTTALRHAGDTTTVVSATASRPPYSVFGQTVWSTAEQARFMLELPCLARAETVTSHLRQVTAGQHWGIAGRSGATFKGGWGPARQSGFEARQLGWYQSADGSRTVVAMAVRADTFPEATRVLTVLAGRLP